MRPSIGVFQLYQQGNQDADDLKNWTNAIKSLSGRGGRSSSGRSSRRSQALPCSSAITQVPLLKCHEQAGGHRCVYTDSFTNQANTISDATDLYRERKKKKQTLVPKKFLRQDFHCVKSQWKPFSNTPWGLQEDIGDNCSYPHTHSCWKHHLMCCGTRWSWCQEVSKPL